MTTGYWNTDPTQAAELVGAALAGPAQARKVDPTDRPRTVSNGLDLTEPPATIGIRATNADTLVSTEVTQPALTRTATATT